MKVARLVPFVLAAAVGSLATLAWQRLPLGGDEDESERVEILAVVDDHPITVEDFHHEMARRGGAANFYQPEARRGLLDEMIRLEVLTARARAVGYLEQYAVQRSIKSILAGRYREKNIEEPLGGVAVSDEEVSAFYEQNRHSFTLAAAANAALIYFAHSKAASEELVEQTRERAAWVRAEAEQQEGATHFGPLAVRHSNDQASRYRGGDIGWVEAGQNDSRWDDAVLEAIFALERPGDLSPIVQTPRGFYVIRLLDTKEEALRPLSEVAARIRQQLHRQKLERGRDQLYAAAASAVEIEIDEEKFAAIDMPAPTIVERRQPPPLPQS